MRPQQLGRNAHRHLDGRGRNWRRADFREQFFRRQAYEDAQLIDCLAYDWTELTYLQLQAGNVAIFDFALGVAVFSGMLGVTFFGIFLTPVFFYVIQWFSDRRTNADAAGNSARIDL
jgi:hypothetical protein